jgi:PPP family 3-phenylpropionic acid transporter
MGVSVSLATLEGQRIAGFGRVRAWGTIGFLISVVGVPPLLHWYQQAMGLAASPGGPSQPGLEKIFLVASALVALGAVIAWTLPRTGSVSLKASRDDYRVLLGHRPFLRVLAFTFLSYLFLQGPMVLFPIYVRSRGGDMDAVSYMWIWMLLFEIPLVASAGSILMRVGPRIMVATAVAAGGVRWLVCSAVNDLSIVYPIQVLHALVVTGLLVGAPLYVETLIPQRLRSTGQGLLMTLGASIGGILSASFAGLLLERVGPDAPYLVGGLGAVSVACLAPLLLPRVTRDDPGKEQPGAGLPGDARLP